MERLHSIQYLRAAAAVAVLLYHVFEPTQTRFHQGAAGVDVFFVISGFIIGGIALQDRAAPGSFLWRRFARVYPPYWAATAVIFLIAAVHPAIYANADFGFENIWKSLLLVPHTAREGAVSPILMQGWTLYYEIFFYLVVAAVIFAPLKLRAPLTFGSLLTLVLLGQALPSDNNLWNVYTNPLLLEFLAGLAIAMLWRRGFVLPPAVALACIVGGLAVLATPKAAVLAALDFRWLVWGAPAALIVAGAIGLDAAKRVPHVAPLRLLGDASYSLYLLHDIVLVIVAWTIASIAPTLPLPGVIVLKIVAAIAGGLAFYVVVERPLLGWLKALPKALPRLSLAKIWDAIRRRALRLALRSRDQ